MGVAQPPLPVPTGDPWSRFSADPRTESAVRASDADRDIAATALNGAFGDGRLDAAEHADRLSAALSARQLGELVPLLSDVVIAPAARPVVPGARNRRVQEGAIRTWLGLAVLFNVIWVATWLFAGQPPFYYWPIWPMIGTAVPMVIVWLAAGGRR